MNIRNLLIIISLFFSQITLADITLNSYQNPAAVGQLITFQGSSSCESVYLQPGDGGSGGIHDVDGTSNTFNFVYAYNTSGNFNFSIIEMGACQPPTVAGQVNQSIVISGSGGGGSGTGTPPPTYSEFSNTLSIKRIELYFDNHQPKITVNKNQKLTASARILYSGTGLLLGHWEVDGRIYSQINSHLSRSNSIEIKMPEFPPLPTYKSGTHKVRLILTSPMLNQPPVALYFVKAETKTDIELYLPFNGVQVTPGNMHFSWHNIINARFYQLSLTQNNKPLFSAQTKKPSYQLKQNIYDNIIKTKVDALKNISWKITAFNKRNEIIGQSKPWTITIKQTEITVNNQFLIIVDDNIKGKNTIKFIEKKYNLQSLHSFKLISLKQNIVVYETEKNRGKLVSQLQTEKGVIGSQPNYISRVMVEPKSHFQVLSKNLNFTELHKHATGKQVKVAVIDTGIDYQHPDLANNIILHNNFVYKDNYQKEIHGTAIAGIIAAATNKIGISGIAPDAQILSLRACRQLQLNKATAQCSTASLAQAIDSAIQQQANIINMSFGAPQFDPLLTQLIRTGLKKHMFFIAAVGNNKSATELSFPSNLAGVISVAGLDDNNKAYPNKLLAQKAKQVAPSSQLFSTTVNNKYNFFDGTSMSTAVISGLVALAIEKNNALETSQLPKKQMNLCHWQEKLLNLKICK